MSAKIGFVGVGRMGANMARRLRDQGHTISAVCDTASGLAAELSSELGATHFERLEEVTATADIVITVVTDDQAQLDVFSTEGDSLLREATDTIFINCATVSPATHGEIEKRVHSVGARSLEACMASSIPQARQGSLYLMCAGAKDVFDDVRSVLEDLSSDLRYIGPAGTAAQVKALVNMVMNINTVALAEGLGLGQALGLDLDVLREVFSQTGANSQVLKTDGEDMQNRDHECYFSAAHAAKDSAIAWVLGCEQDLHLPLSSATKLQFERLCALGLGNQDKSAVAELTFRGRHA
ncbi:MAG: NAD(P)-dependent oxidoreductase [Candidatus Synoicihabitans palmerolidicus]|nr:NAD(P)-dependent oxidoreductase [Candidatus Synoicihabitans palmerolidicus]